MKLNKLQRQVEKNLADEQRHRDMETVQRAIEVLHRVSKETPEPWGSPWHTSRTRNETAARAAQDLRSVYDTLFRSWGRYR